MRFLARSRKCLLSNVALVASFVNFLSSSICYTQEFDDSLLAAAPSSFSEEDQTISSTSGTGYTVNFNNVPIIEVIRFVSKITNTNFIFQEADLQFNVTIISEEPITIKNIMSALIQVLRVYDLVLLEQDNSLMITKSTTVNQIPTIVSTDIPNSINTNAPIITRVFRIKNANVSSIANIIRPLTSKSALIEISNETRQLIVTDITTNVDKIASLLSSLDAPHTPLEIESYVVKNISPLDIVTLTTQILSPFTEGNPLIFVPQFETNTIFIVSTPYLIERALTVMEDVDIESKSLVIGHKTTKPEGVYVYKILNRTPGDLVSAIEEISAHLKEVNAQGSAPLIHTFKNMKYISDTNSLMFVTDVDTWTKVQEILSGIDTPGSSLNASTFYIYKIQKATGPEMQAALHEMESSIDDKDLINTINSMKWIQESNSLIFNGSQSAIQKLQNLLPALDITGLHTGSPTGSHFLLYNPKYQNGEELQREIEELTTHLQSSGLTDPNFIRALRSLKWVPATNSLVFTGDADSIERIHTILAKLDAPSSAKQSSQVFLYKLKFAPGDVIINNLKNLSESLGTSDTTSKAVLNSINNLKWIKENNSLLITGSNAAIEQVKALIDEFDIPSAAELHGKSVKSEFFIYKPIHQTPEQIKTSLEELSHDLEDSGLIDPNLLHTLTTMRLVPATKSILFTGTPDSLEKVKGILPTMDVVTAGSVVQTIGASTFLIYKVKSAPPQQLVNSLRNFGQDLQQSDAHDKELAAALNSVKYIKETNSLLFTGTADALNRVEALAEKFDVATPTDTSREGPSTFVVYNPKYQAGDELISILNDFMQNLMSSGIADPPLFDAISHLKYIDKTNSLIITGDTESITKVEQLLTKFDVPTRGSEQASISSIESANFLIYKLQYHKGSEIQAALKQIAVSLTKSATANTKNLIDAIDSLQWIEVTNSLLGTGDPEILTKIKELIQNLDVPLRQVFIEVLVIETTMLNSQNFGLQWGSQLQYLNKTIGAMGNLPIVSPGSIGNQALVATPTNFASSIAGTSAATPPIQGPNVPNAVPFTSGFDLGVIGDIIMHKGKSFISLGGLINALQVDNATTIVMNPKIITQDGHTSTIFVGQNIPFTGSFVSNTGQNSTVQTSNIEYRDVGVNLSITTTLGTNSIVTLDISQDISEQVPLTTSVQGSTVTGIQTAHTTMSTRVHVPNQHFLVLSGMLQDTKNHFRTSIPCLGGLPVVGVLFSENDRADNKTNVIIFMRPFIIDSFEDYDRVTADQETLYKEQIRTRILKEEFEDGTEMIKSLGND